VSFAAKLIHARRVLARTLIGHARCDHSERSAPPTRQREALGADRERHGALNGHLAVAAQTPKRRNDANSAASATIAKDQNAAQSIIVPLSVGLQAD